MSKYINPNECQTEASESADRAVMLRKRYMKIGLILCLITRLLGHVLIGS